MNLIVDPKLSFKLIQPGTVLGIARPEWASKEPIKLIVVEDVVLFNSNSQKVEGELGTHGVLPNSEEILNDCGITFVGLADVLPEEATDWTRALNQIEALLHQYNRKEISR
jgi:hypothetical protein